MAALPEPTAPETQAPPSPRGKPRVHSMFSLATTVPPMFWVAVALCCCVALLVAILRPDVLQVWRGVWGTGGDDDTDL